MRTRMMLVLLLAAAVPAAAQENARAGEGDAAVRSAAAAGPYRWARPLQPAARAEARVSAPAAAQDTNDFLYHVLLTAVSALVTALIWRAVMD